MNLQREYMLNIRLKRLMCKYLKHKKKYSILIEELDQLIREITYNIQAKVLLRSRQ